MGNILRLWVNQVNTPLGELLIVADGDGNLRAVDWRDHETRMLRLLRLHYGKHGFKLEPDSHPDGLASGIKAYFTGDLKAIDHLPVQTAGTPFQREVWHELRKIPCGQTLSYSKLAEQIGRPAAIRAVGLANGSNPVGIVVPCHRVIGADGSLVGYGGGIERKRWLLKHEQMHAGDPKSESTLDTNALGGPGLSASG